MHCLALTLLLSLFTTDGSAEAKLVCVLNFLVCGDASDYLE